MGRFKIPPEQKLDVLKIDNFTGGLNLQEEPTNLALNQSPDLLNVNLDDRGTLQKRFGYELLYDLTSGTINGLYEYYKIGQASPIFLVNHGTTVYKDDNGTLTNIGTVTDARARWFTFNDIAYMMNGTDFKQYDGTTFQDVDPYIPTITLGRTPDGTAYTTNEEINLLTDGFKDSFSADGTSTQYHLSYNNLTTREVIVEVDGTILTENTHFSVDRVNGIVDFNGGTSPYGAPASGTDNVKITAGRPNADPTIVTKCTIAEVYGGKNDTRVLYSGHSDIPNLLLHSGLFKPNYIPESGYILIGSDAEKITGLKKFYNYLTILKERSIWVLQGSKPSEYQTNPINDKYGCINPDTIQIIENNVIFLSDKGVCVLKPSTVREYINVELISENVNGVPRAGRNGILQEDLQNAVSVEFDNKYWLVFPSGNVFLFDYQVGCWLKYDNIPADCFMVSKNDKKLYFGSNGKVFRFYDYTDDYPFNDNGQAINARWTTKLLHFGLRDWIKRIQEMIFTCGSQRRTKMSVKYRDDNDYTKEITTKILSSFSYIDFDYKTFSYSTITNPVPFKIRLKRKSVYFQVEFSNNNIDEDFSLLEVKFEYLPQRQVK